MHTVLEAKKRCGVDSSQGQGPSWLRLTEQKRSSPKLKGYDLKVLILIQLGLGRPDQMIDWDMKTILLPTFRKYLQIINTLRINKH